MREDFARGGVTGALLLALGLASLGVPANEVMGALAIVVVGFVLSPKSGG